VLLGSGKFGEVVEHWRAQLVYRGERQPQFGLDAGDLGDPTPGRLACAVAQQRGLADPGRTSDDQHGALAATDLVQEAIKCSALARTATEGRRSHCGHSVNIGPVTGAGELPGATRGGVVQAVPVITSPDRPPAGRVAIVTGGTRGVGQATIRRLAARGYAVVVNYLHDQLAAESTVERVLAADGIAVAVRADVADELDVERLFAETIEAFGGIDAVVHAVARRIAVGRVGEVELEQFDALWRINTRTMLIVNREAARRLRNGGAIVNLSSLVLGPAMQGYGAAALTAAGTDMLTQVLALELGERDITVNAVSLAVDRPCEPDRIADVVAHLLGDEGRDLTGRVIRTDEIDTLGLPPTHG
jgi:3-oxoacyl-[acyl-carrier protein] reductase